MKNPIEFVKNHKKAAFIVGGIIVGVIVTGVIIYTKQQTTALEAALEVGEGIGSTVESVI